uniref:Putative secreted protein n=1 Tax=Anopheles marajoara TaxID=58244 RepID=A0A2M4CD48_9DIPT
MSACLLLLPLLPFVHHWGADFVNMSWGRKYRIFVQSTAAFTSPSPATVWLGHVPSIQPSLTHFSFRLRSFTYQRKFLL